MATKKYSKTCAAMRKIMAVNNLSCPDVALIVGRQAQTVRKWKSGLLATPEWAIRLLNLSIDL